MRSGYYGREGSPRSSGNFERLKKLRLDPVRIATQVEVTETEERIFSLLLQTVRFFDLKTQLRVAGGWVRDKLLGRSCNDIDIAVENMTGAQFCMKLIEYIDSKTGCKHKFQVMQSNPEQSKHLETSRMRLYGMELDFVNLRGETYASDSRIPLMEFGTPLEDARRRDLTINSLFFNINTSVVEDHTSKGIPDLQAGIIRTPRLAGETFLDDPLRVLRAVRFGAELNFWLDDDLKKGASCSEVKKGLLVKVSRERIGHEIDRIIRSSNPAKGIAEILELGLFPVTFCDSEYARDAVEFMMEVSRVLTDMDVSKIVMEERRICLYSALLLPLCCPQIMTGIVNTDGGKEWPSCFPLNKFKTVPTASSSNIMRDCLKCNKKDTEEVKKMIASACNVFKLAKSLLEGNPIKSKCSKGGLEIKRVIAGKWVMETGKIWRVALVLSSVLEKLILEAPGDGLEQYRAMEDLIMTLGLEDVWKCKPLLNGNVIKDTLGLKQGNAEIKKWMEKIVDWQLGHSTGTKEDCLAWFKHELTNTRS